MKKYKVKLAQKITAWQLYEYNLEAETPEEALKLAEADANDEGNGYQGDENVQALTTEQNYFLCEMGNSCEGIPLDVTGYSTYEVDITEIKEEINA